SLMPSPLGDIPWGTTMPWLATARVSTGLSTLIASSGFAVGPAALVTVMVYVFVVLPSCAVTIVVTVFAPTTNGRLAEAVPDVTVVPLIFTVALTSAVAGVNFIDVVALVTPAE